MARTLLGEINLPMYFWVEAINTSCYVMNRILLRPILNTTPYELAFNKKSIVGYLKIFGLKCFILHIKENLEKFEKKTGGGIFLGYSDNKKAFRVYNRQTLAVE